MSPETGLGGGEVVGAAEMSLFAAVCSGTISPLLQSQPAGFYFRPPKDGLCHTGGLQSDVTWYRHGHLRFYLFFITVLF